MTKYANVLIGFDTSSIVWQTNKVVVEVATGKEGHDGFPESETIGIVEDEHGQLALYRGTNGENTSLNCTAIWISDTMDKLGLATTLEEMAKQLREASLNEIKKLSS